MGVGRATPGKDMESGSFSPRGWSRLGVGVWEESGYESVGVWEVNAQGRVSEETCSSLGAGWSMDTGEGCVTALNSLWDHQDMPRSIEYLLLKQEKT